MDATSREPCPPPPSSAQIPTGQAIPSCSEFLTTCAGRRDAMWRLVTAGGGPLLTSLNDNVGRQHWEFDPQAGTPEQRAQVEELRENFANNRRAKRQCSDELLRLQAADRIKAAGANVVKDPCVVQGRGPVAVSQVDHQVLCGLKYYAALQQRDGHWAGDYGGPNFLMPGMVIALYATGALDRVFGAEARAEILRYHRNHQNEDGGFGLHIEGHSTMFGTSMGYCVLRIMGADRDDEAVAAARKWIHDRGGAQYNTSWAKFWLAVLGAYSWDGLNPVPPEMWLLPYSAWTGIGLLHPGRMWCHVRQVMLPMSYIYGVRGTCKETDLVKALREELYPVPYDGIDWNGARNLCGKEDLYFPHPFIQDALWWFLYKCENVLAGSSLRKKALKEALKLIHYEDESTRYIDIGGVSKSMNLLACWLEDPNSEAFKKHLARVPDYMWVSEDGMKMQGTNGSQVWDTAFSVQAMIATGLGKEVGDCLQLAHQFLDKSQITEDPMPPLQEHYRHISKGAWSFSTRDHGWPTADCSAEALKAVLALQTCPETFVKQPFLDDRLFDCVNIILSYQSSTGGWPTYENTRSHSFAENFNAAETFSNIMIDYDYVELSSSCMTALCEFRKAYPKHRSAEIDGALKRGKDFIQRIQREDGSWYGSWGVCFTYGTWFGCEALAALGDSYSTSESARTACDFLLDKQKEDGGWGESYKSSQDRVYSQLDGDSHVVNTAWAVMALMAVGYHEVHPLPLHAAARFMMDAQQVDGDWPQQHISGVFNKNCMISFSQYRYGEAAWRI
ncbi:unnamed protein product [Ostreobium quekettii]|uniref:Terpene cyclase/mutase family member n=1 Tax=Ostreobium quekettii TaxID=121088 RepID=A0A8S1ITF4_9CHLO|nr:unnamed protein product [Ostreobium quekettii]